jgi:hypothetical protein
VTAIWYTAPDAAAPAHLPPSRQQCVPEYGPVPDAAPGGVLWGGVPDPADDPARWIPIAPGVWHLPPRNATPGDYLRLDAIAGWRWNGWCLPELMDRDGLLVVPCTARLTPAGTWEWCPPAGLSELVAGLRAGLDRPVHALLQSAAGADLVVRSIAINYHLGPVELDHHQWLTSPLGLAVLKADIGIDPATDIPA